MDRKIDIHSHILNGIDDGSRNIEESISILKKCEQEGISKIILTPHYMENTNYNKNNKEKTEIFNKLKKEVKKQNINIELYLGNEVYANDNILELLEQKEITTLNNSKYILIEFPLLNENLNDINIIYNLKLSNLIPIIAHPERYEYITIEKVEEYIKMGALIQINEGSLLKHYGRKPKKIAKKLLKKKLVHFIGSDIHRIRDVNNSLKIKQKIVKYSSIDYYEQLQKNAEKIIKN
ncbi:MAG: capsular biosynthesis protein [Lactobacillales bacterium]|nr:capsular biosynthesis protein [Lactobacillales bacterium]